jgi:hypothetical protein
MGPEQVPPRVQEAMARLQWQTNGETVEPARDAIDVTAGSGDAREIATVVDRRLRQTFDRHAETYFARQRRRAAL